MTYDRPDPIRFRAIGSTSKSMCDICGKVRGGNHPISHAKCSRIRKARGFERGHEPR